MDRHLVCSLPPSPTGDKVALPDRALGSKWHTILAAAVIVGGVVAVYGNSLHGVFSYDDQGAIVDNATIRRLWPLGTVLSPPSDGQTVSGRPLLNLTLAVNYALGGLDARGYHVVNLSIHLAAALLLFGILRRTFQMPPLRDRFGKAATALALACALVWAVHPLETESVTYIVQRAESLAGCFYLLTLYCTIRGATSSLAGATDSSAIGVPQAPEVCSGTSPRKRAESEGERIAESVPLLPYPNPLATSRRSLPAAGTAKFLWYVVAVLACLLGMATKETIVTAPILVLLYDRTFLAGSFREALRRRWALYLGLAATWGLVIYLVWSTGLIARQGEFGAPDTLSYARTQPGVILHYLRLSFWPTPLCLSYEWPLAHTFREILPGAIVVGLLLAATVWGLTGGRVWGFLGAWFFLILAPTSSILPLTQWVNEHRMYLSLAAPMVLLIAGGYAFWEKLASRSRRGRAAPERGHLAPEGAHLARSADLCETSLASAESLSRAEVAESRVVQPGRLRCRLLWAAPVAAWAAMVLALGYATVARNALYSSLVSIWADTVVKRPACDIAWNNLGAALAVEGKTAEAIQCYQEALRLQPKHVGAHDNLGNALMALGKSAEAIRQYEEALRLGPESVSAHSNLANALSAVGRTDEAIAHCRRALELKPDYYRAYNNLGVALARSGRPREAIAQFQQALRLNPECTNARHNLALALADTGQTAAAIGQYEEALREKPDYADAHHHLGTALLAVGKPGEAVGHLREALRLKPDDAEICLHLGIALVAVGKNDEAMEHFRQALHVRPDLAEAHNALGSALLAGGKTEEALGQYQEALRIKPDYADARYNLAVVLAAAGRTGEAIQQYREVLRSKPDLAEAHNNLGSALLALGQATEAIAQYQEAVRIKPDHVEALYNLAVVLAAVGRNDEAIAHAQRALQLAESAGQKELAKKIRAQVERYRSGRPDGRAQPR